MTNPCSSPGCCGGMERRDFIQMIGLGAMLVAAKKTAMAGPFEASDFERLVPADKKLSPDWVKSLFERGKPEVFRGQELNYVGMPVGGIACGQLYLGGDGALWYWDIFKSHTTTDYEGRVWAGPHYEHPMQPTAAVEHGFAVRVTTNGKTTARALNHTGFSDVSFRGEYPIGRVTYRDKECPVEVTLEAFSPFVPLNVEDSSLPVTILSFTVKNTGATPVEVSLASWLENAVCRYGDGGLTLRRRNRLQRQRGRTTLMSTAELVPDNAPRRPDIVFEDWKKETYEGWTVEGTAFGKGPVKRSAIPAYQGDVGGEAERVVNSHASASGDSVTAKDGHTGKLTSKPFTIERNFIHFWIGGGAHQGRTCLNLVVDSKVVHTATGRNNNRMERQWFDVRDLQGKRAVIEIVDAESGGWGNVGVGKITFGDAPPATKTEDVPGYGSMALMLLDGTGKTSAATDVEPAQVFEILLVGADSDRRRSPVKSPIGIGSYDAVKPLNKKLIGALSKTFTLKPGSKATVNFVLSWWFPFYGSVAGEMSAITDIGKLKRHYAKRFNGADAVAGYVAENFDHLAGQTRLWNKTWYDSTLPYWFLDRTFVTVDCLATQTFHGFDNGRWWGWEGVDCCPGTCQHVWQYAQAVARLFPAIERDLRERVDFGLAWRDGAMDYRAENARHVAHDGFCGTILRFYREHIMSPDDVFLRRLWGRVRQSLEFLIAQDKDADGILEGEQYNTLDASWFGPMAWISSLYLAALAAGEAMAMEMGDHDFAARCRRILDAGRENIVKRLFNGEYFIHLPPDFKHTNTNNGCHIDQVMGQSMAFQVGLSRVIAEKESQSALRSLWKYNFTPDVGVYRAGMKPVLPGGRWYAMPGEAGLLMCAFPHGGAEHAAGGGNPTFVGYFNECMTGFEYQVAAHCVWEGLTTEGLAITRAIHDRYAASKRNPYNEVECSDHYARAMMSYGVFLAACGYEYHGPKGHIGFAPRLTPDNFRAPFTTAEGWGTFSQKYATRPDSSGFSASRNNTQYAILMKWGRLRVRTMEFVLAPKQKPKTVTVTVNGKTVKASHAVEKERLTITLAAEVVVREGEKIEVVVK